MMMVVYGGWAATVSDALGADKYNEFSEDEAKARFSIQNLAAMKVLAV